MDLLRAAGAAAKYAAATLGESPSAAGEAVAPASRPRFRPCESPACPVCRAYSVAVPRVGR